MKRIKMRVETVIELDMPDYISLTDDESIIQILSNKLEGVDIEVEQAQIWELLEV